MVHSAVSDRSALGYVVENAFHSSAVRKITLIPLTIVLCSLTLVSVQKEHELLLNEPSLFGVCRVLGVAWPSWTWLVGLGPRGYSSSRWTPNTTHRDASASGGDTGTWLYLKARGPVGVVAGNACCHQIGHHLILLGNLDHLLHTT